MVSLFAVIVLCSIGVDTVTIVFYLPQRLVRRETLCGANNWMRTSEDRTTQWTLEAEARTTGREPVGANHCGREPVRREPLWWTALSTQAANRTMKCPIPNCAK